MQTVSINGYNLFLSRFLDRSFQDLPDSQLVGHLNDFFCMLERSMDHSMQLPLEEDLQEIHVILVGLLHHLNPLNSGRVLHRVNFCFKLAINSVKNFYNTIIAADAEFVRH